MDSINYFRDMFLELIYGFAFILIFLVGFVSIFATILVNTKFKKIAIYLLSLFIAVCMQISVDKNVVDCYLILKLTAVDSIFFILGASFGSTLAKYKLVNKS